MPLTLTLGERLLLARKRAGLTQSQAAAQHNVSPKRYGLWERDQVKAPFAAFIKKPIRGHELCMIRRRRSNLTQGALARDLGCSRWWLNRMEQGKAPVHQLLDYWDD